MPAEQRGSPFRTPRGWGVRWKENGRRPQESGFASKSDALRYFRETVAPRLGRASTIDPGITLAAFVDLYLETHALNVEASSLAVLRDRLRRATGTFGDVTLREFESQAPRIAVWRAPLAEGSRFGATQALRQTLEQAVRWGVIARNPAKLAGPNPAPKRSEIEPFTADELDRVAGEAGSYAPLVRFAAATGLRPCEWIALERRDVRRDDRVVLVERSFSRDALRAYGKTARSRRRVPLSAMALAALNELAPRIGTPLLFTTPSGARIDLHNWRRRDFGPALLGASTNSRGTWGRASR